MALKEEIKSIIIKSGWTMSKIVNELNTKHLEKKTTIQNLSNKLSRGTLRYSEAQEIAEIIGYTIEWIPRKNINF